ncbi:MAG: glycosyltransferase, partial [Candidatus Zixiibacteriota bacterium]
MSSRVRRTVLFAGGGTGGHLFPAVSIADRIRELAGEAMTVDISFVGTRRGLEYRLGESLGYPLHLINIRGFVRSFTMSNLLLPFIIVGALIASWRLLRRLSPDLIVGSGGYVCWPVLKIAAMQKIPSVLQEQNSFPGITTRQAAASASRIYLGFAEAKQHLHTRATIMITGNPVRSAICRGARGRGLKAYGLDSRKKTILILGGSQGARAINRAVIGSLQRCRLPDNIQLLWQTGKRDYTEVAMQMGSKVTGCSLFPFAEQMETVYAVADLAIARA